MRNRTCFAFAFTPLTIVGCFLAAVFPPLGVALVIIGLVIQGRHMLATSRRREAARGGEIQRRLDAQGTAARAFIL